MAVNIRGQTDKRTEIPQAKGEKNGEGKKRERVREREKKREWKKSGLLLNEVNENKLASGFSFCITVRLN